jgi:deoxyhypusine synthase
VAAQPRPPHRRLPRRERDGVHRVRGEEAGRAPPASSSWAAAPPRTSCSRPSPRSRRCSGLEEKGHDYFVQVTDARPDTGGLSGATPGEAVSWGKVDPEKLPDSVVVYGDSTIVAPAPGRLRLDPQGAAPAAPPVRSARRHAGADARGLRAVGRAGAWTASPRA